MREISATSSTVLIEKKGTLVPNSCRPTPLRRGPVLGVLGRGCGWELVRISVELTVEVWRPVS